MSEHVEPAQEIHDGSEPPSAGGGSLPLIGISIAVAVPVIVVVLAGSSESTVLVILAVLSIIVGLGALLLVMGRLMADPDEESH